MFELGWAYVLLLDWQCAPDPLRTKDLSHMKDYKARNGATELRLEQLILCFLGTQFLISLFNEITVRCWVTLLHLCWYSLTCFLCMKHAILCAVLFSSLIKTAVI